MGAADGAVQISLLTNSQNALLDKSDNLLPEFLALASGVHVKFTHLGMMFTAAKARAHIR